MEELPAEIQMKILTNLYQQDLCSIAVANKYFKAIALDTSLWTELIINEHVMEKLNREGVNTLLVQCNRFSNVKSLKIKVEELQTSEMITLLAMSLKFNSIIEIDTGYNDLREIPIELLTVVFHRVEKLNISGPGMSSLTKDQIIAILKESIKNNSLTELNLSDNDLDDVPEELLAGAVTKLEKIRLSNTNLSPGQLAVILRETGQSCSLIDVNLDYNSFDNVPEDLFSKAISKVKRFDLIGTELSTEKFVAIFTEVCKSKSLVELNLGHPEVGLSEVPKELLARAISKLQKVDIVDAELSTEQLITILEETAKSNSLVELELARNCFGEVPTEHLVKAISKLKKFGLHCTELSTPQLVAILEAAAGSNSLEEINLGSNRLDKVPTELLTKVIPKMKTFDLLSSWKYLTTEQLVAILQEAIKSNSRIRMNLSFNCFDDVPRELLAEAKSKLRNVDLRNYF